MKELQSGKLKSPKPNKAVLFFLSVIALAMVVIALYSNLFLFVDNLYRDQWYWYPVFAQSSFSDIFFIAPNQHRIVLPGFFVWFDLHYLEASNVLLNAAGLLAFLFFYVVLLKAITANHRQPLVSLLVATAFLFWMGNYTFGRPLFSITENFMLMFFVASMVMAISGQSLVAGLLALCSSFSFSLGVLCWPVIALIIFKSNKKLSIYFLAIGLLVLLLYVFLPGSDAIQSKLQFQPVKQLLFVLAYLGTPLIFSVGDLIPETNHYWISCVVGAIGLGLFCFQLPRYLKSESSSLTSLLIGLQAFAVLSAILTALGRADFNPVSVRFINFSILFWLAQVLCLLQLARSEIPVVAVGIFSTLLLYSQFHFVDKLAGERWQANKAMVTVRSDILLGSDAKTLVGWPYNTDPVVVLSKLLPKQKTVNALPEQISATQKCEINQYKPMMISRSQVLNPDEVKRKNNNDMLAVQFFYKVVSDITPAEKFSVFHEGKFVGRGATEKLPFWKNDKPAGTMVLSTLPVRPEFIVNSKNGYCIIEAVND